LSFELEEVIAVLPISRDQWNESKRDLNGIMPSETDAIQPADPHPVSRRRFNRLPNNDCPTNFLGEF